MQDMLDYEESPFISGIQHITDYDEISEVLRARKSFVQGGFQAGRIIMRGTMTVLDGEEHIARRRMLAHLMSDEAIIGYREGSLYPTIEHTLDTAAHEDRAADGVVRTDLMTVVQRCVHRIAAMIIGIDGLEESATADRFIRHVRAIASGIGADWAVSDPERELSIGLAGQRHYRDEFFRPSAQRRIAAIEAGATDLSDLISTMYLNRQDEWDEELVLRESSVLTVAATQTTAASAVLLVIRLHEWLKKHPEDRLRVFSDPEFLRQATYESLRMTVASPARLRYATENVRLRSGREIRSGECVALFFLEANVDPNRFGLDGSEFNPNREASGATSWGLAFGGGAHSCLGRPMVTGSARQQGDGTVTAIVRRLYDAGLELDGEPVRDTSTHYPVYSAVPIRLEAL